MCIYSVYTCICVYMHTHGVMWHVIVVPPLQAMPYRTKFPVLGMRNLPALLLLDEVQYKGLQKQFGQHPLPLLAVMV